MSPQSKNNHIIVRVSQKKTPDDTSDDWKDKIIKQHNIDFEYLRNLSFFYGKQYRWKNAHKKLKQKAEECNQLPEILLFW